MEGREEEWEDEKVEEREEWEGDRKVEEREEEWEGGGRGMGKR